MGIDFRSGVRLGGPLRAVCLGAIIFVSPACFDGALWAQAPAVDTVATETKATALRDAFVARIGAAGLHCPIAVPAIVVEDFPSFGQYDPATNVLRTSDWSLLRPEEKAFFVRLAGPGKDEAEARKLFEVSAHQWILVHELGHWWQACGGGNAKRSHYQIEYGANRISLAYWREVDPKVAETMEPIFRGVVEHAPSPVPAGQSVEAYFDANYETLGPSPAYPWFMPRMNVAAFEERPMPSFGLVVRADGPSARKQ